MPRLFHRPWSDQTKNICSLFSPHNLNWGVGLASYGVGLQADAWWDCGFESHLGHGNLSLVRVVCCTDRGLCFGLIPRPEESYKVCVRSAATITLYT